MSEFQNQFCACPEQPVNKSELGLLFRTNMPAALRVGDYILVRRTDTMFLYMIEEGDMIWNLIVSYFMQKYMGFDGATSNGKGGGQQHTVHGPIVPTIEPPI